MKIQGTPAPAADAHFCAKGLEFKFNPGVLKAWSFNQGRPILIQRCKRSAIASASTKVAVLPWHYVAEMLSPANSLRM